MKYIQNRLVGLLLAFSTAFQLNAQQSVSIEQHELISIQNAWLGSSNAAGLTLRPTPKHGVAELGYLNSGGDFHRAQEGNNKAGLNFTAERYDQMNKDWLVWGRFNFQMNREKERCWSDVINTYNSSPYIFGDSVKGNYDVQIFDLSAKLARKFGDKWAVGMGLDYYAGDMSRLRDARTRTLLANYSATPSVIFKLSSNQALGLIAKIQVNKEKMTGTTTVQADPKIDYYFYFGNENAKEVLNAYNGFDRQYLSLGYGCGLQYALNKADVNWFSSVEYITSSQEILGGERESPGGFNNNGFKVQSALNFIKSDKLWNIYFDGFYNAGSADEYMQEKIETRNPETGITSFSWQTMHTYANRFQAESYHTGLGLSLRNLLNDGTDYSWSAGIESQFDGYRNRYYLPFSETANQQLRFGANGSVRLLNKKNHKLTAYLKGGYRFNVHKTLVLNTNATTVPDINSSDFQRGTYRIAQEVILPDMDFYNQKVIDYKAEARYTFPIRTKKSKITGMAKIYYGNQQSDSRGSWSSMGVSIGIVSL